MGNHELDELLNDLLAKWHAWSKQYKYGMGYPSVDVACRQSRTSRQYDDENGALDASVDRSILEAFDKALYEIKQPWLTALQIQARNLCTGVAVWASPRLPADPEERTIILIEARKKLFRELARDGVLG